MAKHPIQGCTAAKSCSRLQRSSALCDVGCFGCAPSVESARIDEAVLVRSSWVNRSRLSLDSAMAKAVRFGVSPGKEPVLVSAAPEGLTTCTTGFDPLSLSVLFPL